ncbi:MAG: hypothetical protein E7372_00995 [Clostridiales bacterium]|nr:hypothetical protein [Clostridiales bacterium]
MYQLKTRQICFFIIAFLPITKFFSLPSLITSFAKEDLWISALISLAIDFITLIPIVYVCKKTDKTFFEIIEDVFGENGAKIIAFLYLIYFMSKAILPLNEQKDYVEYTLYTLKPNVFYFLPLFILAFYMCFKRIRVLGRLADILWVVTINGFITLIVLSLSNADFSAILPIGASGIKNIVHGSIASFNWFGDSAIIFLLVGSFKWEKGSSLKILLSYVLGAVMVLLFMIIFYSIFTSIAFRQRFALTEVSKYTTVINNLGRFDYIGIFMILFSNMFALCLPIYFSSKLLDYIFSIKIIWISPVIVVGFQLIITLFLYQYFVSIEMFMTSYFAIYFFVFGNIVPIIISLITLRRNKYAIKEG